MGKHNMKNTKTFTNLLNALVYKPLKGVIEKISERRVKAYKRQMNALIPKCNS